MFSRKWKCLLVQLFQNFTFWTEPPFRANLLLGRTSLSGPTVALLGWRPLSGVRGGYTDDDTQADHVRALTSRYIRLRLVDDQADLINMFAEDAKLHLNVENAGWKIREDVKLKLGGADVWPHGGTKER